MSAIELTKPKRNYCFSDGKQKLFSLVSVCCYLWKESMFMLLSSYYDTVFKLTCMSCHGGWEDSECHQFSVGIGKTRLVPP